MLVRTTRLLCRVQRVFLTIIVLVVFIDGSVVQKVKKGAANDHQNYLNVFKVSEGAVNLYL